MFETTLMTALLVGLGFGILAFGALLALVAWLRRHHRAVPDAPALWRGRDYACPGCGAPMAPGWVMLGKGAIFSARSRGRPGLFAHIGTALPNTISMHVPPAANMAWHCAACRLLLLDHGKLVRD